jgi:hypothetical protein
LPFSVVPIGIIISLFIKTPFLFYSIRLDVPFMALGVVKKGFLVFL